MTISQDDKPPQSGYGTASLLIGLLHIFLLLFGIFCLVNKGLLYPFDKVDLTDLGVVLLAPTPCSLYVWSALGCAFAIAGIGKNTGADLPRLGRRNAVLGLVVNLCAPLGAFPLLPHLPLGH